MNKKELRVVVAKNRLGGSSGRILAILFVSSFFTIGFVELYFFVTFLPSFLMLFMPISVAIAIPFALGFTFLDLIKDPSQLFKYLKVSMILSLFYSNPYQTGSNFVQDPQMVMPPRNRGGFLI